MYVPCYIEESHEACPHVKMYKLFGHIRNGSGYINNRKGDNSIRFNVLLFSPPSLSFSLSIFLSEIQLLNNSVDLYGPKELILSVRLHVPYDITPSFSSKIDDGTVE